MNQKEVSWLFWLNFVSMIGNGLFYFFFPVTMPWLCWCNLAGFILSYICVFIIKRWMEDPIQFYLSNALNWVCIFGITLFLTLTTKIIFCKVIGVIFSLASLFSIFTWIAVVIENTEWYNNLERGRMLLEDEENQGAEPDPKDFE